MIGDGAGDRLANPPGGVGAELEAAAIFVLVHRPHQAGVAFLDDVQEREAAVAVFLGDGDDQAQVAAGQLPLGVLVLVVNLSDGHDAAVQVLGIFQHQVFQAAELFLADFQVFAGVFDFLQFFDALLQLDHLGADGRELLHQRRDLAGAQGQLFQQLDARGGGGGGWPGAALPAPSWSWTCEGRPSPSRLRASICRTDSRFIGMRWPMVPLSAMPSSVLIFIVRSKGRSPSSTCCRISTADCKAVIALQHLGAENLAGDFDLLGQGDFLLAGEQGDLAHLRQVHPHRIVDALGRSLGQFGFEIQVDASSSSSSSAASSAAALALCRRLVRFRSSLAAWRRLFRLLDLDPRTASLNSPISLSSMSLMPISSIIISSESSLSGETTSSGRRSLSSS